MLKWMKLRNLALVEEAEAEFGAGFNVITGETGAGKSVIMGAVSLLMGARADHSAIRAGADRCEISAEFQIPDYARETVSAILEAEAAEPEDLSEGLLIRRVITKTGSRNFINGSPVTLPVLHRLGECLIDVHAANATQSLLKSSEQLAVLDRFGKLAEWKEKTKTGWETLSGIRKEKEEFLASMPSAEETERLRRDASEIRNAGPEPGEDDVLSKRHALASHARTVIELAYRAGEALTGDAENSVSSVLGDIRRMLLDLERVDPESGPLFLEQMEDISEKVSSLSASLASRAAEVDIDEAEFQAMEERMRVLQTLKRRYGPGLDDVLAHLDELEKRIGMYDDAALLREQFEKRENEALALWRKAAEALSAKRKEAAKKLVDSLVAETAKLGFLRAGFDISFAEAPGGPGGMDRIEILFSANPGTPLRPLRDTASSGEIARVMLAVKTVLAEADTIPILIFDEIDANIGGETAARVGGELAKLGKHKQVICISHLAQAARCAETHFLVSKTPEEGTARTRIRRLEPKERLSEIARMLGGGKAALEHAKELLKK